MRQTLLLFLVFLVCFGCIYAFTKNIDHAMLFATTIGIAALVYTGLALSRAAQSMKRQEFFRTGWVRLSTGIWVWVIAAIMEFCELVLKQGAYGTIADGFWIFGYVPMVSGMYTLVVNSTKDVPLIRPSFFSWSLLVTALYALMFYLLILPHILNPDRNAFSRILDFVYPTLDVLLTVASIVLIRYHRVLSRSMLRSYWFLFSAFTMLLVCDLILSYESLGTTLAYELLDVPYFCAYMMLALAGTSLLPTRSRLKSHERQPEMLAS